MKTENAKHVEAAAIIGNVQIANLLSSDITVDVTSKEGRQQTRLAPNGKTLPCDVEGNGDIDIQFTGIPEIELAVEGDRIILLNPSSGWKTVNAPGMFVFEYITGEPEEVYQVVFAQKNSDGAIGIAMVGTVSTVRGL